GHKRVAILNGGWRAWLQANGEASNNQSAQFQVNDTAKTTAYPTQAQMPTVDMKQLQRNIKTQEYLVLDARAAQRYRGATEPIDPVAGHIPGARNRPYSANLTAEGRFKPSAQLREEFSDLIVGYQPENIVHQCGSGVTACHNLFALELAGFTGSA